MDETNISGKPWAHKTNSSGMNLNNAKALACLQVNHMDVIDNFDTRRLASENERGEPSLATAMSQVDAQSAERLALASLLGQSHNVIGRDGVFAVRKIS